jgi:hypothetical protein
MPSLALTNSPEEFIMSLMLGGARFGRAGDEGSGKQNGRPEPECDSESTT